MQSSKPKNNQNNQNEGWVKLNLTEQDINKVLEQLRQANQDIEAPDLWKALAERKRKGLWNGEIETIPIKSYSLTKGKHYFVVEDLKKRSIKCISCKGILHGTILEAKYLTRYKLEDGVLSFDGKALNERAEAPIDNN